MGRAQTAGRGGPAVPGRGDAETYINGRDHVCGRHGVAAWFAANAVARTVNVAALHTAAGQHQRIAEVPVVAAGTVAVNFWRAAEIADDHDECSLQQAACVEVVEERRECRIELWEQFPLKFLEVIAVRVPGCIGVGRPRHTRDARAGLDQAAREQDALAVYVAAVGIAEFGWLAVNADGLAHRGSCEQVVRLGTNAVEVVACGLLARRESGLELLSRVETRRIHIGAESQFREREVGSIGIAEDHQRIVCLAEPAAVETRLRRAACPFLCHEWQENVTRNGAGRRTAHPDHRADGRVVLRPGADDLVHVAAVVASQ